MMSTSGSRISISPLWQVLCAMAVSTGVLAYPYDSAKRNLPTVSPQFRGKSLFQSIVTPGFVLYGNRHVGTTKCEAAPTKSNDFPIVEGYDRMPIPDRGLVKGHAIYGVLLGKDMIEEYEVFKRPEGSTSENVVVAHIKLGNSVNGHPGVVHGGILSLLFDDILGYGFFALGIEKAFTANLNVDYRSPVHGNSFVKVSVQLEQQEGRKLFWKAQMTSLDEGILFAECSSLYVIPRSHA